MKNLKFENAETLKCHGSNFGAERLGWIGGMMGGKIGSRQFAVICTVLQWGLGLLALLQAAPHRRPLGLLVFKLKTANLTLPGLAGWKGGLGR